MYIEYGVKRNDKYAKFKVKDHGRISKPKNYSSEMLDLKVL